jgi:hypothetical protein
VAVFYLVIIQSMTHNTLVACFSRHWIHTRGHTCEIPFWCQDFWFPNPRAMSREIFSFSGEISIWNNGCAVILSGGGGWQRRGSGRDEENEERMGRCTRRMYIGCIYVYRVLQHPRLGVYTSTSLSCPHMTYHRDVITSESCERVKKMKR